MSNSFETPLLLLLVGLVLGALVARVVLELMRKQHPAPVEDHRQRAISAELRVAQKDAVHSKDKITEQDHVIAAMAGQMEILQRELAERDQKLVELNHILAAECHKTERLRENLANHSVETIRAEARVRDLENELSVMAVGADVAHDQVGRLTAEKEELSQRLKLLQVRDDAAPDASDPAEGRDGDEAYKTF